MRICRDENTFLGALGRISVHRVLLALMLAVSASACGGSDGAQGEPGPQGEPGAQGEPGLQGETGGQGEPGTQGETGAQGETGDTGDTGDTGEQGDTGDTGDTGEQGETGAGGTSTGSISGTVIDADTEEEIEGATISGSPASFSEVATAADGTFSIADVPIGVYTLTVEADGYEDGTATVSVVAGAEAVLGSLELEEEEEEAPIVEPLVTVLGIGTADQIAYPGDEVAITLTDGGHDQDKIVTSGLANVGAGAYIFLQGADMLPDDGDSNTDEEIITGYAWALVTRPIGSAAVVDDDDTARPYVRTDLPGRYVVRLTATTSGGDVTENFEFYAGDYVGTSTCATCHNGSSKPDKYTGYSETGHATKFEMTYGMYSGSSDYCIRCHTVGYDETANNDGFDDMAMDMGWDATSESLMSWAKVTNAWTLDEVMDSKMGTRANIGCENCHGPGSTHTKAYSHAPSVCGQCHGQPEQLAMAPHGNMETGDHNSLSSSCGVCHTSEGYAENAKGMDHEPRPGLHSLACAGCHDPHTPLDLSEAADKYIQHNNTNNDAYVKTQLRRFGDYKLPSGKEVDSGIGATCVACHNGRRGDPHERVTHDSHWGPHHGSNQGAMLYGEMAYEFEGESYGSSFHGGVNFTVNDGDPGTVDVPESCVTCHMYTNSGDACTDDAQCAPYEACSHGHCATEKMGGHTWAMSWTDPDTSTDYDFVEACQQCHVGLDSFDRTANGDYDGDGDVEGVQSEVKGLIALLEALLPVDSDGDWDLPLSDPPTTAELNMRGAAYNVEFVRDEGSFGIHNTKYAVQLLQTSYKAVTGNAVPDADTP